MAASNDLSTLDASLEPEGRSSSPPEPGIVKIYGDGGACFERTPFAGRERLSLGRDAENDLRLSDARASRRHAEVGFLDGRWIVRDLDSHNGTFLDGERLQGVQDRAHTGLVRIGNTLLLLEPDLRQLEGRIELDQGIVVGPRLARAWQAAQRAEKILHITGETGAGKEVVARRFHSESPRAKKPFVAVNCATIPPLLAERLLFGAKKGAYSGADENSDGFMVTASGGTLLLDEIGELSLEVQAKLLRVIETGEMFPLGASRPVKIELALCSATHADLRQRVAAGKFRQDLYFRIGNPTVTVPPLRERREEIPWVVQATLARDQRTAHVSLMEQALLRPWPGNLRELIAEIRGAGQESGEASVHGTRLRPEAGRFVDDDSDDAEGAEAEPPNDADRARILDALVGARGNVSQAARALGWHRTQLRRWMTQHQIDPKRAGR